MGLLNLITRRKCLNASTESGGQLANDGGHNLDINRVLAQTDSAVISPTNVNFSSTRTAPVISQPRYFTKQEASALQTLAKEKRVMADASKTAYRALKSLEVSDTEVHTIHRRYQSKVARTELEKLQANAQLAKDLHGLRPQYSELHSEVKGAEINASNAIAAIKASYGC